MEHMAFFFAELALMQYGLVAYASAVYAARPNPHCQEKVSSSAENAEALKFKRLSQSRQQLIDWSVKIKISKEHGGFMRFIQVSCLGASASSSRMLRAKAAGEESVLKEFPEPVYVVDVAAAIVNSLKDDGTSMGKSYGLGGPEIYTVHDLAELMYETICEWPRYIDVPLPIARDSGGEQRGIHDNRDRQWLGSVLEPLEFEKDDFFQKKKDWGPVQI
uniref:NmrA-like domain-containing protein n=1 Tax=Oryza rufipogon TaxID=4529 RepID=A0A0E0NM94_ORYRU